MEEDPINFLETMSFIFKLSVFFGISVMYISKKNQKYTIVINKKLCVITIFHITIISVVLIKLIPELDSSKAEIETINAVFVANYVYTIVGSIVTTIFGYLGVFLIVNPIKQVMNDFNEIDTNFKKLGIELSYKRDYYVQIASTILGPALYFVADFVRNSEKPQETFFRNVMIDLIINFNTNALHYVLENQVMLFAFYTKERLASLNRYLKELDEKLRENSEKSVNESNKIITPEKVRSLMYVQCKMSEISTTVSYAYGLQLLALGQAQIGYMINQPVAAYHSRHIPAELFYAVFVTAIKYFEIFRKFALCHLIRREVNCTKQRVHKLLCRETNNYVTKELLIFSRQLFHTPVSFTAGGFRLDMTTISVILPIVATVALMIIQTSQMEEPLHCSSSITNNPIVKNLASNESYLD